jgi:hypothetical protein
VLIEYTDVKKKTFKSKQGLFKRSVMHFILINAMTIFIRMMDDIL